LFADGELSYDEVGAGTAVGCDCGRGCGGSGDGSGAQTVGGVAIGTLEVVAKPFQRDNGQTHASVAVEDVGTQQKIVISWQPAMLLTETWAWMPLDMHHW
jgi:hypothetical protein